MKKLLTILSLSFLTLSVSAQYGQKPNYGFKLGLTATPTIGWMKVDHGKSDGVGLGFSYGLLADFNFAPNYSFSTGLLITTVNGKSTELYSENPYVDFIKPANGTDPAYSLKYKMQYLEIPFTVKLKSAMVNDMRWYGQFGLSNGIKLSAKQDAVDGSSKIDNQDISSQTSFYRAGLIIGGGAEIEVARNTNVLMGLTLNNGFTHVKSTNNNKVKNSYIALNFGVFF